MCLSILPLALTQSREPALPEQISYQPFIAFRVSPLASFGVGIAGLSTATFGSVGPLFASAAGLSISQTALFLVVSIIGGIVSCCHRGCSPTAAAPRRTDGIQHHGHDCLAADRNLSGLSRTRRNTGIHSVFPFRPHDLSDLFDRAAHASDFVRQSEMLALSASLIFIYAAWAMFIFISMAHFLLMLYTVYRNFVGLASLVSRAYAYVPRTSLFIAKIIRSRRAAPRLLPRQITRPKIRMVRKIDTIIAPNALL